MSEPTPATRYPIEKFPAVAEAADSIIAAARAYAACWEVGTGYNQWPGQLPPGVEANDKLKALNSALASFDALVAAL